MTITSRRTVIPHAFVIERRKQNLFDSARLDDFAVTPLQNLPDIDLRTVAPYSTNWTAGEMLFAHTPESALHAPFLYLAQYQQARFVALLDQAQAEENLPTGRESLRPVFVSSVGRCGSTLVCRLARAVGRSVISEPHDYLGSRRSVQRFASETYPAPTRPAWRRIETPPCAQA